MRVRSDTMTETGHGTVPTSIDQSRAVTNTDLKTTILSDALPLIRCPQAVRVIGKTADQLDAYELMQEEASAATKFSARRLREFKLGRACARELLVTLGFADFPVRVGSSRQPIWPAELTGSISHAGEIAICAIAAKQQVAGIGIDIEVIAPETFDLFATVASDAERERFPLQTDCDYLAKLLFSAKESVFKCQFPLTGQWLDFKDVSLALDFANGRFMTAVTHQNNKLSIVGTWDISEQHIVTAAWITAR